MSRRNQRAVWIGGPPGQTFERIREKLLADGIVVTQRGDGESIPLDADIIIVNKDMTDHNAYGFAKEAAKKRGLPLVVAHTSYTRTRASLRERGLVSPEPPTIHLVNQKDEEEKREMQTKKDSATSPTTEEELRKFLMSLPPSLRRIAIQTSDDLRMEDDIHRTHKALDDLLLAVVDVPDATLRSALRRYPDKSIRRLVDAVVDSEKG